MSRQKAGGIFASSFVAGLLLAAAIVSPRAWEPVPGPYFGLDEPTATDAAAMEAAHAELSARKQGQSQPRSRTAAPVASDVPARVVPIDVASNQVVAFQVPPASPSPAAADHPAAVGAAAVPFPPPYGQPSMEAITGGGEPLRSLPAEAAAPPASMAAERTALGATHGAPATMALAAALPRRAADPTPPAEPGPVPQAARETVVSDQAVGTEISVPGPADTSGAIEGSLHGMAQRVRPGQPPLPLSPSPGVAATAEAPAPHGNPPAAASTAPATAAEPNTWAESLERAPPVGILQPQPLPPKRAAPPGNALGTDTGPAPPSGQLFGGSSLGAAPLPGEPWSDPDGVNWSDPLATTPVLEPDRRRSRLAERRGEPRIAPPRDSDQQAPGSRFLERLRGSDRRLAQLPGQAAGGGSPPDDSLPDIGTWPRPTRLEQQLDHLQSLASEGGAVGEAIGLWNGRARAALEAVRDTRGPRDPAADSSLILLGETVLAGMSLADGTADGALATHTRRTALAAARRVAVWRSAAALFATLDRDPRELSTNDAGAAMTKQAAGRTVFEIARLLDGIERFEMAVTATEATAVRSSLGTICGFYPAAARGLAKAVEDHYLAPNVRIAVHQEFLERLLPGATVDTARFQDVVLGREVRGTRTVERTTVLRLVPDEDEISFTLEVHGDIASRSVSDAGAVSVTARSASAFTVQKPFKIGSQGLIFGNATGVASNRSRVDNIQTSFDSVPVMGPLVRNFARNQQADAMPEANREIIDKIISRACQEVDSQAEPQFARIADRVRDRVWMPLVRLGLEPRAVALQTTSNVATMRLRVAADSQLAAHTPRPRSPGESMLSLQLHESSANNAFDRLGVAGRQLTLGELIVLVCSQIGAEPRIPDDLPDDVSVAFAKDQPLRLECRDGLVHVYVKLDAIESGRRDWHDISAHIAYKPVCSGRQVFLEREGPVGLTGKGHEGRMELALRTIFGKVFPKERPIAVLPVQIVENPRLTDVEAVQAVSSDGWLAIALEQRKAGPTVTAAPQKPTPKRQGDSRRRIIFR